MAGIKNYNSERKRIRVIKKNNSLMNLLAILQEESIWILAKIKHMVMYL